MTRRKAARLTDAHKRMIDDLCYYSLTNRAWAGDVKAIRFLMAEVYERRELPADFVWPNDLVRVRNPASGLTRRNKLALPRKPRHARNHGQRQPMG